jgi:hypothetical protein
MASAAVASFARTIQITWPGKCEKQGRALLLRVGRETNEKILSDAVAKTGYRPMWEAYANRPGNTNLETVVLPGPIVYLYRYATEVVEVALTTLQRISPVRSGLYAKSHTIYVDGREVARAPTVMTQEVVISNPVPYARKIEIGKTKSGRAFVIQVPNRIYERTARALQQRYRNVANIKFKYLTIAGHDNWPAIVIGPPRRG